MRLRLLFANAPAFSMILAALTVLAGGTRAAADEALGGAAQRERSLRIVSSTPLGPDLSVGLESEVAYREGVNALIGGDPAAAAEAFEQSIAIRPDRTGAHVLLGASLMMAGSLRALGELPLAIKSFLADFEGQTRATVNLALAVLTGLAFLVLGALAAPILRAMPTVAHEIAEALPGRLPASIRRAYPLVLLVAPLYLLRPWAWPAGAVWLLALYALLVRRTLGRFERRIIALWGGVLVGLPFAMVVIGALVSSGAPRSIAFSLARTRDPFLGDYARDQIEQALTWRQDDSAILFDLALHHREDGRVQAAGDLYERILDVDARHAKARVNLGNIRYARGDAEAAVAEYDRSLAANPKSAAAHYDLGQALSEGMDFGRAKGHFRIASSINFDFVRGLSRATADGTDLFLVDEVPSASERWRWFRANNQALQQWSVGEACAALASWLRPPTFMGCAALLVAFAAAFVGGRSTCRAEPCAACGSPTCRRCRVRISRKNFCEGCAAIARKKAPIDQIEGDKAKRYLAAHGRDRVVSFLLALLLPGAGHVYAGQARRGRVMLFLAGIMIFLVATGGGPFKPLPQLDADIATAVRPALVFALAALHLVGVVHFIALSRRSYS